jgi:hypothetical protein
MVRARARHKSLPSDKMAAGLFALVPLRVCHDLFQAAGAHRAFEGVTASGRPFMTHGRALTRLRRAVAAVIAANGVISAPPI